MKGSTRTARPIPDGDGIPGGLDAPDGLGVPGGLGEPAGEDEPLGIGGEGDPAPPDLGVGN